MNQPPPQQQFNQPPPPQQQQMNQPPPGQQQFQPQFAVASLICMEWPLMMQVPCSISFLAILSLSKVTKQKFLGSLFLDLSMGLMTSVTLPYCSKCSWTSSFSTPEVGSFPT